MKARRQKSAIDLHITVVVSCKSNEWMCHSKKKRRMTPQLSISQVAEIR